MSVTQKICGTLSALGYTPDTLAKELQITSRRAKTLLDGTVKRIGFHEYCDICKMLGVDANFFYFKGERVTA